MPMDSEHALCSNLASGTLWLHRSS